VLDDLFGPLLFPVGAGTSREVNVHEMEVTKPRQHPQAPSASRKKGDLCQLLTRHQEAAHTVISVSLSIAALSVAAWNMVGGTVQRIVTISMCEEETGIPLQ